MSHCHECGPTPANPEYEGTPYEGLCGRCAADEHEAFEADRRLTEYRYGID